MRITVKLGGREALDASIIKASPLGALPTEALVRLGPLELAGPPGALRALADACEQAATMATDYDADPQAFDAAEAAPGPVLDPGGR
jgi:hypothetical protein